MSDFVSSSIVGGDKNYGSISVIDTTTNSEQLRLIDHSSEISGRSGGSGSGFGRVLVSPLVVACIVLVLVVAVIVFVTPSFSSSSQSSSPVPVPAFAAPSINIIRPELAHK